MPLEGKYPTNIITPEVIEINVNNNFFKDNKIKGVLYTKNRVDFIK